MYVDISKPVSFIDLLVLSTDSTYLCQIIWSGQPSISKRCPCFAKNSFCRQSQSHSCRNENPIQWNEFCCLLYVEMTGRGHSELNSERNIKDADKLWECLQGKQKSFQVSLVRSWPTFSDLLKQRFQNNLLAEFFRFVWELCRSLHKRKAMKNILSWYLSYPAPFSLLAATGI